MSDHACAKVLRLIALALDPGASEPESRTAALLAVRLIDQHGLLDVVRELPRTRTGPSIAARFKGLCAVCGRSIRVGAGIVRSDMGWAHKECAA